MERVPAAIVDGKVTVMPNAFGDFGEGLLNVSKLKTGKVTICRLGYSGDEYTMHIMTGAARTPVKWEEAGWAPPAPQLPSLEIVFDAPVEDFIQTWAQYSENLNTSINQKLFSVHKTHKRTQKSYFSH